jgi:hypothetical protein
VLAVAHRRAVADGAGLRALALGVLDDSRELDASPELVDRAVTMTQALLGHSDLSARPGGVVLFDVPYSRRLSGGAIERGSMDCLVVESEAVLVLEFKTGVPRGQHSAQLAAYMDAARAAYPAHRIEGRVVYVPGA